jgi:hypothetical protein
LRDWGGNVGGSILCGIVGVEGAEGGGGVNLSGKDGLHRNQPRQRQFRRDVEEGLGEEGLRRAKLRETALWTRGTMCMMLGLGR